MVYTKTFFLCADEGEFMMLDKNFNHLEKEKQIYQKWEQLELFKARPGNQQATVLHCVPPPNVPACC